MATCRSAQCGTAGFTPSSPKAGWSGSSYGRGTILLSFIPPSTRADARRPCPSAHPDPIATPSAAKRDVICRQEWRSTGRSIRSGRGSHRRAPETITLVSGTDQVGHDQVDRGFDNPTHGSLYAALRGGIPSSRFAPGGSPTTDRTMRRCPQYRAMPGVSSSASASSFAITKRTISTQPIALSRDGAFRAKRTIWTAC